MAEDNLTKALPSQGLALAAEIWYNDHMSIELRIRRAWNDRQAAAAGPGLPEPIKAAVLALVRSTSGKEQVL